MERAGIIAWIEAVVIVILAVMLFNASHPQAVDSKYQFISSRIAAGVLQPDSRLILNFEPLKTDINNYIEENNLNISVYVLNLRDGASFGIRSNDVFKPASMGKLPLGIAILDKIEDGNLSLNQNLSIENIDRDSSSGSLYLDPVNELSVESLLNLMLSDSDNTAARVLAKQISADDLEAISYYLDYYSAPTNNTGDDTQIGITPKSTGNLFSSLYLSTALSAKDSDLMLSMLANSTYDIKKYASLPANLTVVQKYGEYYVGNEKQFHDCGIMYIGDSRIFYCAMTRDLSQADASNRIGAIVNRVYNYVLANKKKN